DQPPAAGGTPGRLAASLGAAARLRGRRQSGGARRLKRNRSAPAHTRQVTMHKTMNLHAGWLPIVMQGSFSEIYIMEAGSLRFIQVNQAARRNLQYSARELARMTPLEIARGLQAQALEQALLPLR